jgi:ATP-dependent DNA helicase RecQ
LRTESGDYASLCLVPDVARPILRGEAMVMLREDSAPAGAARVRRSNAAASGSAGLAADVEPVFTSLRGWRAQQAKAQGIPPYVIFHDSVLRDIAAAQPATIAELGQIKGVGSSKLDRYGAAVLAILAA